MPNEKIIILNDWSHLDLIQCNLPAEVQQWNEPVTEAVSNISSHVETRAHLHSSTSLRALLSMAGWSLIWSESVSWSQQRRVFLSRERLHVALTQHTHFAVRNNKHGFAVILRPVLLWHLLCKCLHETNSTWLKPRFCTTLLQNNRVLGVCWFTSRF